jgi:hypothetical protein
MKIIIRLLLISILLTLPYMYGCSKFAIAKRQEEKRRRELVKTNREKELQAQKEYEDAVQRQYDMQDKATRKSMRKNMKKSMAWKQNKKPCFLIRWFTPKQKRVRPNEQGMLIPDVHGIIYASGIMPVDI